MLEGIKAYYIYMMPIWNVKQTIFIIHKKNITYLNVRRNPLQSNIFEHVIVHITLRLGSVLRILNYQPKRVQPQRIQAWKHNIAPLQVLFWFKLPTVKLETLWPGLWWLAMWQNCWVGLYFWVWIPNFPPPQPSTLKITDPLNFNGIC